jgi:hypothetical protein
MTPLLVPILSLPVSIVDADTNTALAITLFWAELLLFVAVGVWAVITSRPTGTNLTGLARNYPAIHSLLYLAVFAILWLTAAPELLGASNGLTDSGTPTGNPVYVLGCFAFCIWVVVRALRAHFAEAVEARVAEPAGRRS